MFLSNTLFLFICIVFVANINDRYIYIYKEITRLKSPFNDAYLFLAKKKINYLFLDLS